MKFFKNKLSVISCQLSAVIFIGAFLRFYNLGWGLPYPFHPDERNMADAITRFSSGNLDPQFYAYGQFPLYLAYFTGKIFFSLINKSVIKTLTFPQVVLTLRFWSAFFSTATIYIVYLISRKILPKKKLLTFNFSLLTATAVAFTPGLIQSAHFGTTESLLTFCFLAIVYFSFKNYFWSAFFLGIALGTKISAAVFAVPLFLATLWQLNKLKLFKEKLKLILKFISALSFALTLTLITSPYLLLAYKESRGILLYEIAVAQGKIIPFYTRQFINTVPVIFQSQKIFPYALGLPIFIFGTTGLILIIAVLLKKFLTRSKLLFTDYCLLITAFSFLAYFVSNAFLFTKWTRFMTPVFPFFSIFAVIFLSHLSNLKYLSNLFVILAILPGILFSSIYFRPDIRFVASEWIYQNIPSNSRVLSETANVVDIPVPSNRSNVSRITYHLSPVSFDFYSLDENPVTFEKLVNDLVNSDYIFIPSRRLFANNLRLTEKYPLTAKYYQLLFSGKLGFQEIKTFSPFPNLSLITYHLSLSDENAEETFSVFDHPVIRIYQKEIHYNRNDYENFFKD